MNSQFLSWFPLFSILVILEISVFVRIPLCSSNPDMFYETCGTAFSCGRISGIGYPFRGNGSPEYCGYPGLVLYCNQDNITTVEIVGMAYRVLDIDQTTQIMRIAREDMMESRCPQDLVNTTLDYTLFDYASTNYMNVTFIFGCPVSIPGLSSLTCGSNGYSSVYLLPGAQGPGSCNVSVVVPAPLVQVDLGGTLNTTNLDQIVQEGFQVKWKVDGKACSDCTASSGRCGYNFSTNQSTCYCSEPLYLSNTCLATATAHGTGPPSRPIVALLAVAGIIVLSIVILCCYRRKWLPLIAVVFWKKETTDYENVEAFVRTYGSQFPKHYRYTDLKKMTNEFTDKLGQGGYGSVFKGALPDGCLVAVKLLNEAKGGGEEFINEVASTSRTSHVNVVKLLGFCFEGSKRALIYEFMPNSSLDKFICSGGSFSTSNRLDWETLYQIALGTARGLEYLHRGCNTRIVHFDIKPQNILLDEDFCPKISDFGLAKLCKRKESALSMMGARGTPGYIAPEIFFRNFGAVSHKSDVYSYGMMVLEMTGVRENAEVQATRRK